MKAVPALFLASLLSMTFSAAVPAEAGIDADREISHLLSYLETSDCDFYRNGSWHDSARAVKHLNRKYEWLAKRDLVPTTEAFIERAGTESSMSGKTYLVRCPGEAEVPSAEWLHGELTAFRANSDSASSEE